MRIWFVMMLIGAWFSNILAQRITREQYIEKYKDIAIAKMHEHGIPASITLAQGMLESDNGNSKLVREGNNHFGIKCHNWQGKKMYHDDDRKNDCFRKYASDRESFEDHSVYLKAQPRYRELFQLQPDDYKGWAHGLKRTGYATNPQYAQLLIKIIEDNDLHRFDTGQSAGSKRLTAVIPSKIDLLVNNHVRYVIAQPGETYTIIANNVGVRPSELRRYNEVDPGCNHTFSGGEKVYLQPKRRKAAPGNNWVEADGVRNLHSYSQEYAIKVERLAQMNFMTIHDIPKAGTRLSLRKRNPAPSAKSGSQPVNTLPVDDTPAGGTELQFEFSF